AWRSERLSLSEEAVRHRHRFALCLTACPQRSRVSKDCGMKFGVKSARKTTIDTAGRVLIPKDVRREAALAPGTALEAEYEDGRIILRPAPLPLRIRRKGAFAVAMPEQDVPRLRQLTVDDTRRRVRKDRASGVS